MLIKMIKSRQKESSPDILVSGLLGTCVGGWAPYRWDGWTGWWS